MLAVYMNNNRSKHARPVKPEDLNPYADSKPAKEEKIQLNASETVAVLRKVFLNA